ncbi:DUF192 domain-containing protein [Candidatus Peregrinibacteria bacterium]|nr:DUF192 domain-containing protein [Candidatus Peregrinibacteria bacterium]
MMVLTACQKSAVVTIQTAKASIPYVVELAVTPEQNARGLMFRKSLSERRGMLFVYDKPLTPSFWMKNTLIPLDILFIGADLRIKHIAENTPPCPAQTACPTYSPTEAVQYVLELNGGEAVRHKIGVGDSVDLTEALK